MRCNRWILETNLKFCLACVFCSIGTVLVWEVKALQSVDLWPSKMISSFRLFNPRGCGHSHHHIQGQLLAATGTLDWHPPHKKPNPPLSNFITTTYGSLIINSIKNVPILATLINCPKMAKNWHIWNDWWYKLWNYFLSSSDPEGRKASKAWCQTIYWRFVRVNTRLYILGQLHNPAH